MTKYCEYYSSDEEKRSLRGKRGKRGYPGFQGPQGATGPQGSLTNFYGQFLRLEDQFTPRGGNINFDYANYENGISLSEEPLFGSFIQVENPGLYSISYKVKFANPTDIDYIAVVQLTYNFIIIDAVQGTLFGKSDDSEYSITNFSNTRLVELDANSTLRLNWNVSSSDVYLLGGSEPNPGALLSITRIA